MQNVRLLCFLYLLIIGSPFPIFAQETLVLENTYFQDEIIRKVSVGEGAVWVIKGADSTGVGKLEPSGNELDYSLTVNSAVPLTGIVGKYGDSVLIATKGNNLLLYDKGTISRLDQQNGISGSVINDIHGSAGYTRVATNQGAYESYDNKSFTTITNKEDIPFGQEIIRLGKMDDYPTMAYINKYGRCYPADQELFHISLKTPPTLYKTFFDFGGGNHLNALATNQDGRSYYLSLFLGDDSGLRARNTSCYDQKFSLLQDTAVYSISRYKESMLVGTEKGLFYCATYYPQKAFKIDLGGEYQVFDVFVDSNEKNIWLATNKGLLKLKETSASTPKNYFDDSMEWTRKVGGNFPDKVNSSAIDKEGNLYTTGSFSGMVSFGDSTLIAQNKRDFFLAKYNPAGELVWVRSAANVSNAGRALNEEGSSLRINSEGQVYVIVSWFHEGQYPNEWEIDFGFSKITEQDGGTGFKVIRYDSQGTPSLMRSLGLPTVYFDDVSWDIDQNNQLYAGLSSWTDPYRLIKYSPEVEVIWDKSYPANFKYFKLSKNGDFYLSGKFYNELKVDDLHLEGSGDYSCFVYFSKIGKALWAKQFPATTHTSISGIADDSQGNIFLSGKIGYTQEINGQTLNPGYFYGKLNPLREYEWIVNGTGEGDHIKQIQIDSLGNSFLAGQFHESLVIDQEVVLSAGAQEIESYILKFDALGNLGWAQPTQSLTRNGSSLYLSTNLTEDISIQEEIFSIKGGSDLLLTKITDTTSYLNRNIVRGKAFYDKNKNNLFDEGDEPVKDNIIKALPGPVYAKSDEEGNYYLYLDEGSHTLDQLIPAYKGKRITQTSPSQPYTLILKGTKTDTAGFDFGHDVQLSPHLSADVSSTRFRRCFRNNTVVEYCNEGFAAAENVQLVLEYPDYVIPLSSNIPWSSKNGNILTFDIGTLQAQHCRTITLTDSVMCGDESIRGLTQCIKAFITPANGAEINPAWDQSEIELTAICKDNGFVRLGLQNTGKGDMADSASFKIFLSEELSYTGKYKLKQEETLSLNVLANSQPLHLEAELSPFHPQKKMVSISIDGCEEGEPEVQHAFTRQFPQQDDQDDYELSCLEIIDSYDPNDKLVIPAGIAASHYVAEESLLEYTIRFQNTGTDTAYTVVITDLLDQNLDVGTLEVGVSSHPVKWTLSGEGEATLVWRFNKINLPDSSTNEKASHGFVKFKIRPKEEAGFGAVIRNKAAIYFDYNSPIITNEVFSTIGIPEGTAEGKPLVQYCNSGVNLLQEEDVSVVLCESDFLMLSREVPEAGRGLWTLMEGQGTIKDKNSSHTLVEGLGYGTNVFQWEVTYCDVLVRSTFTVLRKALPAPPLVNPVPDVCQGDPLPLITAEGQNIEWYADSALTQLLGTGNMYQPKVLEPGLLYVIQRNQHCQSLPAIAALKVYPRPAPPLSASVEACIELEDALILTAEGRAVRWYAEPEMKTLLGEGAAFQVEERVSRSYYVTQSSENCESYPTQVEVRAKAFDPAKTFFANVITPNGDEWNQFFYVNEFETEECLGKFVAVKVFDRLGKKVFESTSRDFQWMAEKEKPGIYFYSMEFALHRFNGTVQVLP